MERELEEKREDLKKTETVFEELHSFCAEREQKIEELTKDLEEVKKQQETKERKTAADHKKKLQETENNVSLGANERELNGYTAGELVCS